MYQKKIGKIIIGNLDGTIFNGQEEKTIDVALEKTADNLYYALTIYNDKSTDGDDEDEAKECAIVTFGQSQLDQEVLKEIGKVKKDVDTYKDKDKIKDKEKKETTNESLQNQPITMASVPGGFNHRVDAMWNELNVLY